MAIDVIMASHNSGKLDEAHTIAEHYDHIKLVRPSDVGISEDVDETGGTYQANAQLKRDFFIAELTRLGVQDVYVFGDDSGVEIDALGGEPGIHTRRWHDGRHRMTDQEIIDYCLERLAEVPPEQRIAHFAGAVALGHTDTELDVMVPYRLTGQLLEEPRWIAAVDGYPFRALFYLPEFNEMLGTIVDMDPSERPPGFKTHREMAIEATFDKILELEGFKPLP